MTREEKIRKAAEQYTKQQKVTNSLYDDEGDMYECVPSNAFIAGAEWQKQQFRKIENYQDEGWYSSGDDEYIYGISFEEPIKLPVEFYYKKKED